MLRRSLAIVFFIATLLAGYGEAKPNHGGGFVGKRGSHFVLNSKPVYFNGFNAYWMMCVASDPSTKYKVTDTFKHASKLGINVVRTWAFSDGGNNPLQRNPGVYNEDMFKALDFVVSEAKKHGIYLILSLVNNWDDFGGKKQYVKWANDEGHNLKNEDDFFTSLTTRIYYKNHVNATLTRVNFLTRVAYKDDPTILGWELMNEPRCQSDLSGKSFQSWVAEMSAYVKLIDKSHLLEIGLEGFYGESMPKKKQNNLGYEVGTDFISNNLIPQVDFATIHIYTEWFPSLNETGQAQFVEKWIQSHIDDSKSVLGKPILVTEFGKSSKSSGYKVQDRDNYFRNIFSIVYNSARAKGACGGALFWQVMAQGMDNWSDGYEVVFEESPSTVDVISLQSSRIASLNK